MIRMETAGMILSGFLILTMEKMRLPGPGSMLLSSPPGEKPYPLVICLQGNSTEMLLSLGWIRYARDETALAGGRDFGRQTVRQGYTALVLEQRAIDVF